MKTGFTSDLRPLMYKIAGHMNNVQDKINNIKQEINDLASKIFKSKNENQIEQVVENVHQRRTRNKIQKFSQIFKSQFHPYYSKLSYATFHNSTLNDYCESLK